MSLTSGDELAAVKSYFETEGFKRWDKIYGETDEVNNVQLDIRIGHAQVSTARAGEGGPSGRPAGPRGGQRGVGKKAGKHRLRRPCLQTVEKVLKWLDEEGGVKGVTVADCGCGTGSLAIPLALRGAAVSASDISSNMAKEAQRRYESAVREGSNPPEVAPVFEAKDLESVDGKYHTVTCLDVMIHYPQDKADAMVQHLASLADKRLILSFAPKASPRHPPCAPAPACLFPLFRLPPLCRASHSSPPPPRRPPTTLSSSVSASSSRGPPRPPAHTSTPRRTWRSPCRRPASRSSRGR